MEPTEAPKKTAQERAKEIKELGCGLMILGTAGMAVVFFLITLIAGLIG